MPDDLDRKALLQGRLLVVTAALLWSTSGLFVKGGPLAELPPAERGPLLACYRAVFAAVFLLPFVRFRTVRWRPALLPMTLAFAAMNGLYVTALTRTTAAAAIFLQYTSAVWAFLLGVVLLKEPVDRANVVALVSAVGGIVCIVAGDWTGPHFAGNLIALASGLCYAGVVVGLRYLRDEDAAWLVFVNHALAGLVLLPWALHLELPLTGRQWTAAAAFGVLQMALPYVLFARGVRTVTAQEAALIPLIEPILNPLWVALVWKESVPAATLVGGALIVGGLAVRYLCFREAKKR